MINSYTSRDRKYTPAESPGYWEDDDDENSTASNEKEKSRRCRCIISHNSNFKIIWDWIILLLVLFTSVQIPYYIAFPKTAKQQNVQQLFSDGLNLQRGGEMTLVAFAVDLMFLLDILINFRTTYLDSETDEIISNPKKIAIHYLKTWFAIDFVAAIPFDWFPIASEEDGTATLVGLLKSARLLRLFRVARKLDRYSEYGIAVLFLLMSLFTLIAHWLACVWHVLGKQEETHKAGWLYKQAQSLGEVDANGTVTTNHMQPGARYIASLYFVMTSLTSVGFGNIAANTKYEQIFAIVVMLVGALMYASIFGNMVAIVQRLSSRAARFHTEMNIIKEFLRCYKIPDELRRSVQTYFRQEWSVSEGVDAQSVLRRLPESLQKDICYELYQGIFAQVVAFRGATISCMRALGRQFRTLHFQVGHFIIRKGDQVDKLFIIGKGSIEVIKDGDLVTMLAKSSIFGYDVLGQPSHPKAKVDLRAFNTVELHYIDKDDFNQILMAYPKFSKYFKEHFVQGYELGDEREEGPKRPRRRRSNSKMHIATVAKAALRMSFFKLSNASQKTERRLSDASLSELENINESPTRRNPSDGDVIVTIPNGHTGSSQGNTLATIKQDNNKSGVEDTTDDERTQTREEAHSSKSFKGTDYEEAHSSKACKNIDIDLSVVHSRIDSLETRMNSIEEELTNLRNSFELQFRTVNRLLEEIASNVKASKTEKRRNSTSFSLSEPEIHTTQF